MEIREICYYLLIMLVSSSAGYLLYCITSVAIPHLYMLRFINFLIEHILGIVVLIKRKFFCQEEDACQHLVWMIGFTGINFVNFLIIQIYGLTHQKAKVQNLVDFENADTSFIILSYFHLYYQLNIYLGVFCLFSIVMGIVYLINQRRHNQQMEDVLEDLQSQKYDNSNNNNNAAQQQNCSICLVQFQKSQSIYKLVCGHIFHKQCLKDWFLQKLTCPMCRDDVARGVHQRSHRQYLVQIQD